MKIMEKYKKINNIKEGDAVFYICPWAKVRKAGIVYEINENEIFISHRDTHYWTRNVLERVSPDKVTKIRDKKFIKYCKEQHNIANYISKHFERYNLNNYREGVPVLEQEYLNIKKTFM